MALVGVFTGYRRGRRRCAGSRARCRRGLVAAAFVAALVNTVVASLGFVVEYAIGGAGGAALGTVFAADGRAARADRHRRGPDHRGHGGGRRGHPARPGVPRCATAGRRRSGRRPRERRVSTRSPVPASAFLRRRPADRGRGVLLRQLATRTGWTRSRSRAAGRRRRPAASSSTGDLHRPARRRAHDGGQPARRLRRRRRRRHHRASPGSSGCCVTLAVAGGLFWLLRPDAPGADRDPRRGLRRWAPATPTRCTCRATPRCTGCPAEVKIVAALLGVVVRGGDAARGVLGVRRATLAAARRGVGGRAGSRSRWIAAAVADRGCRSWCSRCCCRSPGRRPARRRARAALSEPGLLGAVEHPGQGHARRAHLAHARRHHARCATCCSGLQRLRRARRWSSPSPR